MKIHITHVSASDVCHIWFETAYGSAHGQWMSEAPQVGQTRLVELDVDERLVWKINVFEAQTQEFHLDSKEGGVISLQGYIVTRDEDVTVLKLGECLLLLSIEGEVPRPGTFISMHAREMKVFDTAL